MANEQEDYDLEKVYDEKLAPPMTEILRICKEANMPMFASFAYKHSNDDGVTSFCTSYLAFPDRSPGELLEAKSALTQKPLGMVAMTITTTRPDKKA